MPTIKQTFTTGQVAKICGVSANTVCKWIDRGVLAGYRIPDSRARRVHRTELRKFLIGHGFAVNAIRLFDEVGAGA